MRLSAGEGPLPNRVVLYIAFYIPVLYVPSAASIGQIQGNSRMCLVVKFWMPNIHLDTSAKRGAGGGGGSMQIADATA